MEVLNHVFLQDEEHHAGFDAETLEYVLRGAGFSQVKSTSWRSSEFPGGCIDRETHRSYSIYYEARP